MEIVNYIVRKLIKVGKTWKLSLYLQLYVYSKTLKDGTVLTHLTVTLRSNIVLIVLHNTMRSIHSIYFFLVH